METSARLLQRRTLTVSPEASAILEDYRLFLRDIWGVALTAPEEVLSDALQVLVERYRAFRHWRQQHGRPQGFAPLPAYRHSTRAHPVSPLLHRRPPQQRRRV